MTLDWKLRRDVLMSNYGRWIGWRVHYDGLAVCSLSFHSQIDELWDAYVISDQNAEVGDVCSDEFWNGEFTIVSRLDPTLTVENVVLRWGGEEQPHVLARSLCLPAPSWSLVDAVRFWLNRRSMPTTRMSTDG